MNESHMNLISFFFTFEARLCFILKKEVLQTLLSQNEAETLFIAINIKRFKFVLATHEAI